MVFDKDKIFDYLKILKGSSTPNYGIDNSYKENQKSEPPPKPTTQNTNPSHSADVREANDNLLKELSNNVF